MGRVNLFPGTCTGLQGSSGVPGISGTLGSLVLAAMWFQASLSFPWHKVPKLWAFSFDPEVATARSPVTLLSQGGLLPADSFTAAALDQEWTRWLPIV